MGWWAWLKSPVGMGADEGGWVWEPSKRFGVSSPLLLLDEAVRLTVLAGAGVGVASIIVVERDGDCDRGPDPPIVINPSAQPPTKETQKRKLTGSGIITMVIQSYRLGSSFITGLTCATAMDGMDWGSLLVVSFRIPLFLTR